MPEILINVVNKIPQLTGDVRQITSGNGDYTVRLVFDDDWADGEKTVLFVRENGFAYPAVRTENDCCAVPEVNGVPLREWLYVGVKQGDVYTSRPCGIAVYRSIDDMISDEAVQPDQSLWDDILARLIAVEENVDEVVSEAVEEYLRENPIGVPTKVSELENDTGFITRLVNDLANYYRKSETYTREEVDGKISAIPKFSIAVVNALPTENISGTTVYLVRSGDDSGDLYTEYIFAGGAWEILGSQRVDLTGYVTDAELANALKEYAKLTDIPETVPPGNIAITVMGRSLDDLAVESVMYPADAPEGYDPEDSIAAGNVTMMLMLLDGEKGSVSIGTIAEHNGGVIASHMNLVQDDAVTSLILMVDISDMTAHAEVFTEFTGGGNSSVATGWTEILPETTAVNDDPNAVFVGFPPIDVSVGDVCRVYYQGNNYSAEAVVTAVEGEFAGEPTLILSNINPDEVNGSGFVIYVASGLGTIAGDRRGSASITLRIEKRGDCVGWTEFDELAKKVEGKLDASALTDAVNDALAQAKESGEFDGEPGQPGTTPHIGANGNWYIGGTDTGVKAQGEPGAKGDPGQPGAPGADYVLTADDKTEIAQEAAGLIDAALLSIIGEVE